MHSTNIVTVIDARDVLTFGARRTGDYERPLCVEITLRDESRFVEYFVDANLAAVIQLIASIGKAKQLPDSVIGSIEHRVKDLLPPE